MSVRDTIRSLETAYSDWGDHLANPNYCRSDTSITWQNRKKIWLRDEFDYASYQELIDHRQYSFVIADNGGLIQLYYRFDHDEETLLEASASFYGPARDVIVDDPRLIDLGIAVEAEEVPETAILRAEEAAAGYEAMYKSQDEAIENIEAAEKEIPSLGKTSGASALVLFVPSLRIDYTPKNFRPFVHDSAHLHIPGFSSTRICVSGFPSPEQFIETVFAWFYPASYEEKFNSSGVKDDDYRLARADKQRDRWLRWPPRPSPSPLPWIQYCHHAA